MNRYMTTVMKFFKDSEGQVVIWQTPNVPLIGWVLFTISSHVLQTDAWQQFAGYMSFGFLFTWAWLEMTRGDSYFRRTVGFVILMITIYSHLT